MSFVEGCPLREVPLYSHLISHYAIPSLSASLVMAYQVQNLYHFLNLRLTENKFDCTKKCGILVNLLYTFPLVLTDVHKKCKVITIFTCNITECEIIWRLLVIFNIIHRQCGMAITTGIIVYVDVLIQTH